MTMDVTKLEVKIKMLMRVKSIIEELDYSIDSKKETIGRELSADESERTWEYSYCHDYEAEVQAYEAIKAHLEKLI